MRTAIIKQCLNLPKTIFSTVSYYTRTSSLRYRHTTADNEDFTVIDDQSPNNMPRRHIDSFYDRFVFPEPPEMISNDEHEAVISNVNKSLEDPGRLFAVVAMQGHQYKITSHDLLRVNSYLPAECGQKLRLEKVLLVGGKDFTLLGRPVLKRNLVEIMATVIEKTPGADMILKKFLRRNKYERTHKRTTLHTVLRINSINVISNLK